MSSALIVGVGVLAVAALVAIAAALHFARRLSEEKRRLAAALQDQAKFASDIFDSLTIGLAMRDLDGRYVFVNSAWETFTGAKREDVIGKTVHDRAPKDEADAVVAEDRAVLARAPQPHAEAKMQDFYMRGRHFMLSRTVLTDAAGKPRGILVASIDATERHLMEQKLRDQIALTEEIVKQMPNAVFTKDAHGRFVMVNRGWSEMSGVPAEKAIGRTVHDIYPASLATRFAEEDAKLLDAGGDAPLMESVHQGPRPGQYRIVRKAVLRRADGTAQGLISTSTDITELKRVERELDERVKFINELVDALPISVAMRDTEGRYKLVNRMWERYFDIRREDAIGRRRRDLPGRTGDVVRAEDAERIEAVDRELLALGPDHVPEPRELVRFGRYYLISSRALADSSGKPIGILSAGIETTERRAMEEALAAEQRRFELVVRAAHVGILDWDGISRTAYYSGRFKEILGYPADADTSVWPDYFDIIHPEDRPRVQQRFRQHILEDADRELHETIQYRLRRMDGSYVWIEAVGASVRDAKGFATRFIASITDISERRAQEEALVTEQRRLDLVVHAARVGIVDWDGHTHATYYSPRLREILGYAPDADTSVWPDYFKVLIHPEDRGRVTSRWRSFIFGRGPEGSSGSYYAPEEYRLLRADGSYVWVQVSGVAVRDESGFVTRWIAATTDITERRAQEEALRASVRLREEVERMSRHDLRTPLNSVIAMSRLLRENTRLASEDAELLGTIERAGYRILNMVNLSLDLFRMESGTYQFHPQPLDLSQVARRVAADLESQAASKNIYMRILPERPVLARADELLCYSMLANLLKNAIEAAPEGETVSITLKKEGASVLAEVHNPGAVAEAIRPRFFQKYATAGKSAGLGLGTYSAQLMARVQRGEITLHTSEAAGTTLVVRLEAAEEGEARAPSADGSAPRALAQARAALPALRVLVVDDDEFNRLVLRRTLPTPPFTLATAVNGRAALEAAEREWPDVVLLDLEMPVMDGYAAAGALRAMEAAGGRKPLTIVAVSSNDEQAIIDKALAAGCDFYLTKPAPREALWRILQGVPGEAAPAAGVADPGDAADAVLLDPDLEDSLPAFLATRRAMLEEMPGALDADERGTFRRLAHKLAGSFSLFGFAWASAQCRALERDALHGDAKALRARVEAVREHLASVPVRFKPAAGATEGA